MAIKHSGLPAVRPTPSHPASGLHGFRTRRSPKRPSLKVLVVAAWEPELAGLRSWLSRLPELRHTVHLRAAGVGMVEAALGTARAIAEQRVGAVIFVGTAGVYPNASKELRTGTAALASRLHLLSLGEISGAAYRPDVMPSHIEPDSDLAGVLAATGDLPSARVACPVAITRDAATALQIAQSTHAELENLEAFAAARAAAKAGVPFAAVLGISNAVGPSAHQQWLKMGDRAASAACAAVTSWLEADALRRPRLRFA
jgi:purine-nucleoside phosphorylase